MWVKFHVTKITHLASSLWNDHHFLIQCFYRGLKGSCKTAFGNLKVSWKLYIKGVGHQKANSPRSDTQRKLLYTGEFLALIINKLSFSLLSFSDLPLTLSSYLPFPPLSLTWVGLDLISDLRSWMSNALCVVLKLKDFVYCIISSIPFHRLTLLINNRKRKEKDFLASFGYQSKYYPAFKAM